MNSFADTQPGSILPEAMKSYGDLSPEYQAAMRDLAESRAGAMDRIKRGEKRTAFWVWSCILLWAAFAIGYFGWHVAKWVGVVS